MRPQRQRHTFPERAQRRYLPDVGTGWWPYQDLAVSVVLQDAVEQVQPEATPPAGARRAQAFQMLSLRQVVRTKSLAANAHPWRAHRRAAVRVSPVPQHVLPVLGPAESPEVAHNVPMFACDLCPSEFVLKEHLKRHVRTHTRERSFTYPLCRSAFSEDADLQRRLKSHDNVRRFACDL
ncbi:hypothetical protein HPB52_015184 [Rhipicephalus sanguineus]|uniref:C2H2-type domain-containing protein n=1 Tax=Rhipicephalus sanguineus TaxID=34632 RepID=A0A9D4SPC7_RHISA|nr:hypothetical protein HPB52_015184 [Rhipicephalus sanguineus]